MTIQIPEGFKQTEIGLIPEEWAIATFNDVAEVIGGGTPSTKKEGYFGGNIPWLTPKDLSGYSNKYISKGERNITDEGLKNSSAKLMPKGTVLLTSRAPVGYVAIAENEISTNQGFKSLICKDENINNYFMYYYLKNNKDYLEGHASGSTFKELSGSALKKLHIPLPNINEQKAIAEVLSSLDDKIELLEKQNKTLENIGQAIFKSWFVDFEGFEDDLVESEMGMIPRGWKVESLDENIDFLNGLALQKYKPKNDISDLSVIKIRELTSGITRNTDKCNNNLDKKFIVNNGDIIFSWSGTLKVILWGGGVGALNQHLFKVDSNKYNKGFIYYWLLKHLENFIHIAASKATTMGHIQRKHLSESKILIPDEFSFNKISTLLGSNLDKVEHNNSQLQVLKNLRDSLLPRLMNGKLRVNK